MPRRAGHSAARMRAGIAAGDRTELSPEDVIAMLRASIAGIKQRGDSDLGDKTLLDALVHLPLVLPPVDGDWLAWVQERV